MADPRFFNKKGPFTLKELAELGGAQLHERAQPDFKVTDVSSLKDANTDQITFLDNEKYKKDLSSTKAGACILKPAHAELAPENTQLLISPNPYKTYALIAQTFYPLEKQDSYVPETASIHPSVEMGEGVTLGENVVIQKNVKIGKNVEIQSNTVICEGVTLGNNCRIESNVTISHAVIGNKVRIFPGVRIGQDGFGFAIDPSGHISVPQLGRVIIEDGVEIGANTTIDRGAGPDTVIGAGARIDNLVQIGHNVKIGKGAVIVAQTGISGSTEIGDFAVLGGQSGVAGHLKIGMGAQIAAQSGISKDVPAGEKMFGTPAQPIKDAWRALATLNRLAKKGK